MRGITAATFLVVFLLALLSAVAVRAQVPVVINAPPTVISDNRELRSNETLNVSAGGVVGNSVTADGGTVNISGGTIGYRFASVTTTKTTITGGEFGREFFGGGSSPGFTKISGGTFARQFRLQGDGTELIGGEFRLNGTPISGSTNLPLNSVFTGVLKDGTVFMLSPLVGDGIANIGAKLTTAALPVAPTSPLTVSSNNGPRGLRA